MEVGVSRSVIVLLDDDLLVFQRVIGVVRRRNLPVRGLRAEPSESPGAPPGGLRLSFFIQTDEATAERLLHQLAKAHGVRRAELAPVPVSNPSEAVL
ncbi:MAG TPA: hypothetical protein VFC24_01470 [Casimicrobiaceae bacterium]|nr:hypothetical protein [Casimicrobiaceae bacterium]